MQGGQAAELDRVFGALAHPVRRDILDRVSERTRTVAELAGPHELSLNAISKHIKKLESAGLVRRDIDGTFHRISMEKQAMRDALQWLSHYVPFWHDNLQSLKATLERD